MFRLPFVDTHEEFPPVSLALEEPSGLLCWGGELNAERLQRAYRAGIFPWYSPGEPVLWWSPSPRMVLPTAHFKLQRSLFKTIRNAGFEVRVDTCFERVMRECAAKPREGQAGTWITDEIVAAYGALHAQGYAHSVEAWRENTLVGGLYGVAIGQMFFGESMFAHERDASKVALAHLVTQLARWGFPLIDCQQETAHLASLGAAPIERELFCEAVARLVDLSHRHGPWTFDQDLFSKQ
jgi:leucyl/phenylalanyl-tRNA---protein transferase